MSMPVRVATFNLENLDDKPDQRTSLDQRIEILRPQLLRLNADILCLQEVNGQEVQGEPRQLLALDKLLAKTPYAAFHRVSTMTVGSRRQVYDERNLVILSRYNITNSEQYMHQFAPAPSYQKVTAQPSETKAEPVRWERPILHATIELSDTMLLEVINLHLKSRIPTPVSGQGPTDYKWHTASGWAEGFFLSSMKRVGQALETRILIDQLFDANEDALIVVCGDFNADSDEVAVEAMCGAIENTNNPALIKRVLVPCERTIPEPSRYSLVHRGKGRMLDHVIASRQLMASYRGAEIHNELLHDESIAFMTDELFPESDHAPVIANFEIITSSSMQ